MVERQIRIVVVLGSALAALLLLYWLWEAPGTEVDPEADTPVWAIDAAEIVRLEVDRPDGRLVLDRQEGDWRLVEPVADRADPEQVDYLLGELERIERGVGLPEADPDEVGLGEPPKVRVTATLEGGTRKSLDIGEKAPVGWRTYVEGADGSVVAVGGIVGERMQMAADDLRDPHPVHLDVGAVREVRIEGREGTLAAQGEGDTWWLEGWGRADPHRVEDLLVGLNRIRFETFADEAAPAGIADPDYRVTVRMAGDRTAGFEVGESGPPGTLVRSSSGRAGWVPPERLALLGQGPTDLGVEGAFPVEGAERVEVRLGDVAWAAVREGDAWVLEGSGEADAAVEALSAVPIHYQRDPGPPIEREWGRVLVHEGDEPRTVVIGQRVGERWRVAKDTGGGSPYLVPVDALAAAAP